MESPNAWTGVVVAGIVLSFVTALATIGQALIAAWSANEQTRIAGENALAAKKQRIETEATLRREREQLEDLAYNTIYAEWFRLFGLYNRWRKSDFIGLSLLNSLEPDEVKVRDASLYAEHFGRLGVLPARLGTVGLTMLDDAAHELKVYNMNVDLCAAEFKRPSQNRTDIFARVVADRGDFLDDSQERMLNVFREALLLIEDAMQQSPRAHASRRIEFIHSTRSRYATGMSEKAEKVATGTSIKVLRRSEGDILTAPADRALWRTETEES